MTDLPNTKLIPLTQGKTSAVDTVIYIYGLFCPVSLNIRYVGKSVSPQIRFLHHLNDKADTHKVRWIKQLAKIQMQPSLVILEKTTQDKWEDRERYWIANLKDSLTNETLGGDGREKGFKHKPQAVTKISNALKKRSALIRKNAAVNTSIKLRGRSLPDAHCIKLSNAQKSVWKNLTKRKREQRLNNLHHGWKPESRKKMSLTRRGKKRENGTSKYNGVSLYKRDNKWRSWLYINGKQLHLGYFETEIEAAIAYNEGAKKYHGEFAKLNKV